MRVNKRTSIVKKVPAPIPVKDLAIIIPTKNEESNIGQMILRIDQSLTEAKISYEIIVVDDYSSDKTVEVVNSLKKSFPVQVFYKKGIRGKAYSILEGLNYTKSENIAMIDADLQYPPEAIPEMFRKLAEHGMVVANREEYNDSFIRGLLHKGFSYIFGNLLHGFNFDVQSGLKLFKKEIGTQVNYEKVTPWTIDLTLLTTAKNLGFSIGTVSITFDERKFGESKVNFLRTSYEIGSNALAIKVKQQKTFPVPATKENSMLNAGVIHQKKRMITHTTLNKDQSALITFTLAQKIFIGLLVGAITTGFYLAPLFSAIGLLAIITVIYFTDVLFNLFVVLKSLQNPPEISATHSEISAINNRNLPTYTVLCPLYKEAHILPHFLESIAKIDWPKSKLEVLLLLEEDDTQTQEAAKTMDLPFYVKVHVVPNSQPKTKPKACNYGLQFTTGKYLVIYDAEDVPDSDQLKKAYLGFQNSDPSVVCLQAKLNYFNPHQNLLTRFFTAEYSLWFDVVLPGLQMVNTALPLGGTSNHFKTDILKQLEGWDPFNVTEDCDLGIRLFKKGYKTAMIDSTTLEEANSNTKNWLRQRSRWIKGYMQTYLVHMRNPIQFVREFGIHAFLFQLIIGARISFMLINPFLWLTTVAYFALFAIVGSTIEALFPSTIFYLAVFSLIFGNFLYIYNYMIGCAKREHWTLIKYVFLIPLYWLLASASATIAFYQLITKPHYWEKTNHGLHLNNQTKKISLWQIMNAGLSPIKYVTNAIF